VRLVCAWSFPCPQVQQCTLLSIKTGGCPETCNYCSQSSSWKETTGLKAEKLMAVDDVLVRVGYDKTHNRQMDAVPHTPHTLTHTHTLTHSHTHTHSLSRTHTPRAVGHTSLFFLALVAS
jgi:hypothetical protein